MDLHLTDRTFVVTAASSGLGLATAEQLVAEGAKVVLVARRAELLDQQVAALGAQNAVALPGDLAETDLPARAADLAVERFGRLDGAMISVGGPPRGDALENSDDEWRDAFDSVFLAALRAIRAVVDRATGDDTAIGLVLSTSAKAPLPGLTISNGLRPGLAMLVKQYARELGPRGVRVFGLLPGSIRTARMAALAGADDPEAALRRAAEGIPVRRVGEPADFGRVAAFALSPAAAYLSGFVLPVDGGTSPTP